MKIRKAERGDLAQVVELYRDLQTTESFDESDQMLIKAWEEILADRRLFCFVTDDEGKLLSTCILDIVPNLTRGARPFGVLQNVVTRSGQRGKGVGSRLNRFVLDFAWEKNCYQVLVQTGRPEVVSFYERLGFKQDKIGLVAKPEWCRT